MQVILFGGACSKVTDQIVKAARHWSLVQVNLLAYFFISLAFLDAIAVTPVSESVSD